MDPKEDCSESQSSSNSSCGNSNGNVNGDGIHGNGNGNNGEVKKCTDCQTTTTPLWRGGPAGPKTLCNACGIKYHKKRRALLGIEKGKIDKCKKKTTTLLNNNNNIITTKNNSNNNNSNNNNNNNNLLKIKVMSSGIRQREKLGEVEQAALLLMALSYGSVYA
ncbi:hypothetical protein vseg_010464 [Gypsophila vaccaria]